MRYLTRVMSFVGNGSGRLSAIIMSVAVLLIVFSIAVQVVLRYVFKASMPGAEELGYLAPTWLWFFAAAYATYRRFYISSRVPLPIRSVKKIIDEVVPYFSLIVTLGFCYYAYRYCYWTYSADLRSITLGMPLIYATVGAFLGLVLMAVCLAQAIVERASVLFTGMKNKQGLK